MQSVDRQLSGHFFTISALLRRLELCASPGHGRISSHSSERHQPRGRLEVERGDLSICLFTIYCRMSWIMYIFTSAFYLIWTWQLLRIFNELPGLFRLQRFYRCILEIDEERITCSQFSDVVEKVSLLQQTHPITAGKLDAHEVCNRIMRRENYLIALFNKDIFNVQLPLGGGSSLSLSKTLEWNISFCLLNYVFDENCTVRKAFIKDTKNERLSEGLKRRFVIMGLINLALFPFILLYLLVYFIFRYGEEIYRNPKTVGMRQYTTAARWKLREFNELPHYFNRRLANSHRKATKYLEQFQSSRLTSVARLSSFIAGSFTVVLIALTVVNEDLLMHFEISAGKSVIWYIGLFGVVLALSRTMMPDWSRASDPSKLMNEICEYTHYMPKDWKGRLHTDQVRSEFSQLFDYKFMIFFKELISVTTTPFVLLFSFPKCTDRLVEFIREFTVHVDGLGYVCSFALFDFKRHGNRKYGGMAADKHHQTKQGKMEKSFLSFVSNNPNWKPDEIGSQFLNKLLNPADVNGSTMLKRSVMTRRASPLNPLQSSMLVREHDGDEEEDEEGSLGGFMTMLNQYVDRRPSA